MKETFTVHITRAVEEDLEDLKQYRERVVSELLALEGDPYKGHSLRGPLKSLRSLEFSLPGGVCRAVYALKKKERVCLMVIVGYHEGIYDRAERRVKKLRQEGIC